MQTLQLSPSSFAGSEGCGGSALRLDLVVGMVDARSESDDNEPPVLARCRAAQVYTVYAVK